MYVVIGIFCKQIDMSFGRRIDRELHGIDRPGTIPAGCICQADSKFVLIGQLALDGFAGGKVQR